MSKQAGRTIGIKGYKVSGDGIVYAPSAREALRKIGEDLVRASETPDSEDMELESFVRGGLRFEEMTR